MSRKKQGATRRMLWHAVVDQATGASPGKIEYIFQSTTDVRFARLAVGLKRRQTLQIKHLGDNL